MDLEGILQAGRGYGAGASMAADPVGLFINYTDNVKNHKPIQSKKSIPTFASQAHKKFNPDLKNYKSYIGKILGAGTTVAGLSAIAFASPLTALAIPTTLGLYSLYKTVEKPVKNIVYRTKDWFYNIFNRNKEAVNLEGVKHPEDKKRRTYNAVNPKIQTSKDKKYTPKFSGDTLPKKSLEHKTSKASSEKKSRKDDPQRKYKTYPKKDTEKRRAFTPIDHEEIKAKRMFEYQDKKAGINLGKYTLIKELGKDRYGIPIIKVREKSDLYLPKAVAT
jgi:hypothetical protein